MCSSPQFHNNQPEVMCPWMDISAECVYFSPILCDIAVRKKREEKEEEEKTFIIELTLFMTCGQMNWGSVITNHIHKGKFHNLITEQRKKNECWTRHWREDKWEWSLYCVGLKYKFLSSLKRDGK